ncbi:MULTISPECIES: GGDEF domain-containing protein [Exiguobacterium]|uniref:GGDEF domain-containing protein n=1 Tax=Exiguobacterium TaxID=33986 RepID=UPI001BE54C04|nr:MULTISPECIES: GGDEF domain-containing protein [Exiguobacterium]MCT4782259.1 GGDEF domain-containing protein [Exiguobacterium himgiriensis]
MNRWSNESLQLIGLIASLLIGTILYTILLVESDIGFLGLLILPVIVVSSLAFGMRAGLTISVTLLIFLFIYFLSFAPVNDQGEVQFFNWRGIGFTILLLVLSVVSGLVHQLVKRVQQSRLALEERARQLIAVDPETWLDNAERFRIDVISERDRLVRHGGAFSVSFITIHEFSRFEEKYGRTEYEWFLNYFSDELHTATRRTDQKYRIAHDTFAILFPYTSPEAVQVVHDRLRPLLEHYELQSGEYETLTYDDSSYEVTLENAAVMVDAILEIASSSN